MLESALLLPNDRGPLKRKVQSRAGGFAAVETGSYKYGSADATVRSV